MKKTVKIKQFSIAESYRGSNRGSAGGSIFSSRTAGTFSSMSSGAIAGGAESKCCRGGPATCRKGGPRWKGFEKVSKTFSNFKMTSQVGGRRLRDRWKKKMPSPVRRHRCRGRRRCHDLAGSRRLRERRRLGHARVLSLT